MKNRIYLWSLFIILFSCKKDDDNPILCECPATTNIEINSDSEIINFADTHICSTWSEGDHNSAMYFSTDLVALNYGGVSYFSIRTSSNEEGTYDIVNHQKYNGEPVPKGKGVSIIQVYVDTILSGANDHYAINSGTINVWTKDNGKIIKCIKDGEFTSITNPSNSFIASLTIVCDK